MAKQLRLVGIVMIGVGALVIATYVIRPLRVVWEAYCAMPLPVQIGVAAAALGLVVLMVSLVAEKRRDDRSEGDLTVE